ncbi:hypothetical protein [Robertmurraya massiliosenegalensis]|uniref:hypothetical protein n=1 Tax=Robertmurraya massiliosenegalensis TaxID=1287657 RepID=UPI00036D1C80|nr:hypothetical protein [Robertmurraya massiliosenegalensis]
MTVNYSSVLSEEYFESYFNLIISARGYKTYEAKEFIIENFFKGNVMYYGEDTYQSFIRAYSKMKNKNYHK